MLNSGLEFAHPAECGNPRAQQLRASDTQESKEVNLIAQPTVVWPTPKGRNKAGGTECKEARSWHLQVSYALNLCPRYLICPTWVLALLTPGIALSEKQGLLWALFPKCSSVRHGRDKDQLKALKRTEGWVGRVSSVVRSQSEERSVQKGRSAAQPGPLQQDQDRCLQEASLGLT